MNLKASWVLKVYLAAKLEKKLSKVLRILLIKKKKGVEDPSLGEGGVYNIQ